MNKEQFQIGDRVTWVDGMSFEAHGVIKGYPDNGRVQILTDDGRTLYVNPDRTQMTKFRP